MNVPKWFIPIFIFAVIDWVIAENVLLVLVFIELVKIRHIIEALVK